MDNKVTIKQIADILQVSKPTVMKYINRHNIPKEEILQGNCKVYYIDSIYIDTLRNLIGGYIDISNVGGNAETTENPQNPIKQGANTEKETKTYKEMETKIEELAETVANLQNQLEKQLEINVMLSQSIQSLTNTLSLAIEDKQETIEEIQEDNREVAEMQTETKKSFFNFFRK